MDRTRLGNFCITSVLTTTMLLLLPSQANSQDQLFRILQNGKWGYINQQGEVLVKPQYELATIPRNGIGIIKRQNPDGAKEAYIDLQGNILTDFRYDEVFSFYNNFGTVRLGNAWGFVNQQGNQLTSELFERVGNFNNGFATVYRNGKWGLINDKGEITIPLNWDSIQNYNTNGYNVVFAGTGKDRRSGLIRSRDGAIILPAEYLSIFSSGEGFWSVSAVANQWSIFNPETDPSVPTAAYQKSAMFTGGMAATIQLQVSNPNRIINSERKVVHESPYPLALINEGFFTERVNNKFIIKRLADKQIMGSPQGYDAIGTFRNGVCTIGAGTSYRDRKWGLIDTNGNIFVQPELYTTIGNFDDAGMARVYVERKVGIIDREGNTVIAPVYDYLGSFSDGLLMVQREGRWGYVDRAGTVTIPLIYDRAWDFVNGLAVVRTGSKEEGRRFYINTKGEQAFTGEYDWAYSYKGPLAHVANGPFDTGEFGYIDRQGRIVWELQH